MRRIKFGAILFTLVCASAPLLGAGLVPLGAVFEVEPPPDPEATLLMIRNGTAAAALPGGFVAVWQVDQVDVGLEDTVIEGRTVSPTGDLGSLFPVVGGFFYPREEFVICPGIVSLGGDLFLTAWHWSRFAGSDVAFLRQRTDGTELDSPFRILGDSLDGVRVGCPALAGNSKGGFAFAWAEEAREQPERVTYRLQAFGTDGEPAGPIVPLGPPVSSTLQAAAKPDLGIDWAGRTVAVWPDGSGSLVVRRFRENGAPRGNAFRVGRGSGAAAVAISPDGGFVVAWSRAAARGRQVLLRGFDAGGRPLGLPRVVARTDGFASPALRLDRSGRVVLFWADGTNRWVGRLFTPIFELLGGEVYVGRLAGREQGTDPYAGLAVLGNRVFTVWSPTVGGGASQPILGRYFAIEP